VELAGNPAPLLLHGGTRPCVLVTFELVRARCARLDRPAGGPGSPDEDQGEDEVADASVLTRRLDRERDEQDCGTEQGTLAGRVGHQRIDRDHKDEQRDQRLIERDPGDRLRRADDADEHGGREWRPAPTNECERQRELEQCRRGTRVYAGVEPHLDLARRSHQRSKRDVLPVQAQREAHCLNLLGHATENIGREADVESAPR